MEKTSKNKTFIDQYNWNGIDFSSYSKEWKKFEQNNETIAPNILFVPYNTKNIRLAHESKHFNRKNQVILLMITDGKKWHYLAVKGLPVLLRGIISNHNGDFYWLNCFHSYSTKNELKKHERVCNDHDYYHVEMPNEDNKTLKYNDGEKTSKVPFMIYADLESLKKYVLVKIILKNLTERKKLSIRLPVTHCLQSVHLMRQKTNLIITKTKTVLRGFKMI